MKILVVNVGSSSHKLSLFDLHDEKPLEPLWEGSIEWGREDKPPSLKIKAAGKKIEQPLTNREIVQGVDTLLNSLWQGETQVIQGLQDIERVGHRVVHGGTKFVVPTLITSSVKKDIQELIPLAPLHNHANLQGIELMEQFFPKCPQIAVFDTAYHATLPDRVKTYPLPWEWKEKGIQRYGFHGTSHHYCAERIASLLHSEKLKIINCHLGNGCSLCAIKEGKSFETTMGFTPLEGLMMGTRCGSIDPAILLYLLRENKITLEKLYDDLHFASGLKGIGGTSDMREIMDRQEQERPQLALQMFIHRLKTFIGAMAASLDGCDVLSFTAGIGENSPFIRQETCQGLTFLNLSLDQEKNQNCQPDEEISTPTSSTRIFVIHTREEWMIARACLCMPLSGK